MTKRKSSSKKSVSRTSSSPVSRSTKSLSYWDRFIMTFSSPSKLFKSVENEKGYLPLMLYYGLFGAVYMLVYWVYANLLVSFDPVYSQLGIPSGALFWVLSLISVIVAWALATFAFIWISPALSHLGVMLFGGKQGYYNTFKPLIYGGVVGLVYSLIFMLLNIIGLFTGFIGQQIFGALGGLVGLAGLVHVLVIDTIGVSIYHKLSGGKAFFGIILVPLILGVILFIFLLIFFIAFIGVMASNGGLY